MIGAGKYCKANSTSKQYLLDSFAEYDDSRFWLPNAFTPNNDGVNDSFKIISKNFKSIDFRIYKGGEVIFETIDLDGGWDGKDKSGELMNAGLYKYNIVLKSSYNEWVTEGKVSLVYPKNNIPSGMNATKLTKCESCRFGADFDTSGYLGAVLIVSKNSCNN